MVLVVLILVPVILSVTVLVLILILVLVLVLILILVLVLVLILLVVQKTFRVGVVVLGLHVGRIQFQRVAVARQSLLELLLRKLRIAQIVKGLGTLLVAAQRVGRRRCQQLLGLVVLLRTDHRVAQIIGSLKVPGSTLQRLLVAVGTQIITLARKLTVALAHQRPLGHALRHGRRRETDNRRKRQ